MEERLDKHRNFLVDRIDPDFGLLDKLMANKILTREAVHEIKLRDNTTEKKNRILLGHILENKKANDLVSALRDSGQTHLFNYINADGGYRSAFADDWPLGELEINRLDINRESLVDLLDTSDLCIRLFSEKVINYRQKQLILSKPTDADKNDALLDILTKFSLRQYKVTLACLKDSNQSHIAELLSEGGVIVRVHANLEGAFGNRDELEDEIISKLKRVLGNRPSDEAIRLLDLTKLDIIAVKKGQSIVIYIQCTTHNKLQQLIDLLKTDKLKGIIEKVFTEMLSIGNSLMVTLTWSLEEFKRASTHFEWAQKRFSEKKSVLKEAKETETNPQGIKDSDDVSLSGDLQSKLTVTERPSLSTELVEESPRRGWMQKSSNKPKPLGKLCGCDASTQTDEEPLMNKKTERPQIKPTEGRPDEQDLRSSAYADESRERKLRDIIEYTYDLLPSAQADEVMEHIYENIGGDLFLALENLKVEGDILEGSKEKQEPRYIRALENFYAVQKQRQQKPSFQLPSDPKEEEIEPYYVHQFERIKQTQKEQMSSRNEDYFDMKRILEETQKENDMLKKQLEHQTRIGRPKLPDLYKSGPVLVHTIRIKAAGRMNKTINGLTILDNELFVVSGWSSEVEVFDSIILSFSRRRNLKELINPWDIGSCNRNKCLYIVNYNNLNKSNEILRVDPDGKVIKKWSTGDDCGRLSVTDESNVILSVYNKLNEYSPDGDLIREINLSSVAGIGDTMHAIKTSTGLFVISHGRHNDELHRVCVVDASGKLKKSFGGERGSTIARLNRPGYLSVDGNGFVMVLDQLNCRVLLLDSDLKFMREILSTEKHGLHNPWRILLDESNGRLFVTDNETDNERILIFKFK